MKANPRYEMSRTLLLRIMRTVARTTEKCGVPSPEMLEDALDASIELAPLVGEVVTTLEGESK